MFPLGPVSHTSRLSSPLCGKVITWPHACLAIISTISALCSDSDHTCMPSRSAPHFTEPRRLKRHLSWRGSWYTTCCSLGCPGCCTGPPLPSSEQQATMQRRCVTQILSWSVSPNPPFLLLLRIAGFGPGLDIRRLPQRAGIQAPRCGAHAAELNAGHPGA